MKKILNILLYYNNLKTINHFNNPKFLSSDPILFKED